MQLTIWLCTMAFVFNAALVGVEDARPEENEEEVVVTEYQSEDAERYLWDTLSEYTEGNDMITAGIMGYFWRESFLKSNATAHWPTVNPYLERDVPVEFTAEVDAGLADGSTRDYFIESVRERIGGYGLGQLYSNHYLEDFYDFARDWGTSIGDARMQCAFTVQSMQQDEELWATLLEQPDAEKVGQQIAHLYDGSEEAAEYIGQMAKEFYEEYAASPAEDAA